MKLNFFVLSLENLIDTYKAVVDEEETKFKDWQGKEAVSHKTVNGSSNLIRNILFQKCANCVLKYFMPSQNISH